MPSKCSIKHHVRTAASKQTHPQYVGITRKLEYWTSHASWSQRLPLKTPSSKKLEDFASSERRPCWIHFLTLPLKKEAADSKFNSAT
jgi:hypothetical protein